MSSNLSADDDTFPWAWLKAVRAILNQPPPSPIPTPPVECLPWLYLSPFHCVPNKGKELEKLGITHILSLNTMAPKLSNELYYQLLSHGIQQEYIASDDQLDYNMLQHWDDCKKFLDVVQEEKGKVLVHCLAGMNRSGTIVAAAMIYYEGIDLLEVVQQLKAKRGYVLSNQSFQKQLVMFAKEHGRLGKRPDGYTDDAIVEAEKEEKY